VKRDTYFVLTSYITDRIKEDGTMEKKMKFFYDKEGDVLDISLGEPEEATSEEIGDDTIIRVNEKNEIVGVTILNFEKRFEKSEIEYLPLYAKFSLIQN
jgi:uncharacterized protein YuzE